MVHLTDRRKTGVPAASEQKQERSVLATRIEPARDLPAHGRLEQIRALLGKPFMSLLKRIDRAQKQRDEEYRLQIETDYLSWVLFFEEVKRNFKELWDFFAVVEADAQGWFRFSPHRGPWGSMGLTTEGYTFGAGIELNQKPNAAFPRKWMLVTLAHSNSWTSGIGDERMLGREGEVDEFLIGLANCKGKGLRAQHNAARELKERAKKFPLVFQMFSEKVGQKSVKVPASILEERPLLDLCQHLFVALNKDVLTEITEFLPGAERIELDWKR